MDDLDKAETYLYNEDCQQATGRNSSTAMGDYLDTAEAALLAATTKDLTADNSVMPNLRRLELAIHAIACVQLWYAKQAREHQRATTEWHRKQREAQEAMPSVPPPAMPFPGAF